MDQCFLLLFGIPFLSKVFFQFQVYFCTESNISWAKPGIPGRNDEFFSLWIAAGSLEKVASSDLCFW